jgi:peptidoglycan/LPS O-acetylase OafA/YrhL
MEAPSFSVHDTNVLKGIAILGISFHNFFHRLPSIVQENEFEFDPARFPLFLDQVFTPATTIQALLAFLGHYGVGVFVTLSCYGLARSSFHSTSQGKVEFLKTRYRKIFPTIGFCIAVWLLLQLRSHAVWDVAYWSMTLLEVILLCTGLLNIIPGFSLPAVGPWWFIPFILQFYLLWSIAGEKLMRMPTSWLLALSAVNLSVVYLFNEQLVHATEINLLETPFGRFPEIALGILLLRFRPSAFGIWSVPLIVLLLLSNVVDILWPLGSVCATAILLITFDQTRRHFSNRRALAWVGSLSLPIFMLNGFIRRPFLALSTSSSGVGMDLMYSVLSVGSSIMVAALIAGLLEIVNRGR